MSTPPRAPDRRTLRPADGRDSRWLVGLAALAIVTRLLFHTRLAYSWDVANFILATRQFDLRLHLPHPLGYLVWVWLGRVGTAAGLEAHAAYLAWNALAAALGTGLLYCLGRELWGRGTAVAAGVLFVSSPLTWFYSGTGYADIWDATLGAAVALLAWRQQQAPRLARAVGVTLVYSAAAGIRQQNLIFLFPLWVLAIWPQSWRARAALAALLALVSVGWAIPLVNAAGGAAGYFQVVQEHSRSGFLGYAWSSWKRFLWVGQASIQVARGLALGIPGAVVVVPLYFLAARGQPRGTGQRLAWWREPRGRLLLLWGIPSLLFLLVVHLDVRPGLMLGMLPPALLATAAAATHLRIPPGKPFSENPGGKLLVGMVAVNLIFFLLSGLPTSRAEMAGHDARLAAEYRAIRQRFPPGSTLLLSNSNWYWYSARQAAVYLPEYEVWYVGGSDRRRWWASRDGHSWTLAGLVLPPWVETLVFIHDHRIHADNPARGAEVDPGLIHRDPLANGTFLCWMPVGPGDRDLIDGPTWRGPRPGSSTRPPASH
jgi:hypothetical protein